MNFNKAKILGKMVRTESKEFLNYDCISGDREKLYKFINRLKPFIFHESCLIYWQLLCCERLGYA
ncbi:MAG: hypothetical protein LBB21_02250 [Holosporaceae bacterium]|jgi:hypothetical protein|nr:hypothetical protein [Holosporaceae bacterium]